MANRAESKRLRSLAFVAFGGIACGRPVVSMEDDTGSGASTTSAMTTTSSGETGADTTGAAEFDACSEALLGRWQAIDIDRVGDMDGDGVEDIAVLGRTSAEATLRITLFSADGSQASDGTLAERTLQEVVFGQGFPDVDATKIAGLDDVNGDGWPDIGVATYVPDAGGRRVRVYVLLGAETTAPMRELHVDGSDDDVWLLEGIGDAFVGIPDALQEAISLSSVGDLDDDGFADIVVQPADGRSFWVVKGRADVGAPLVLEDVVASGDGFRVRYSDEPLVMKRNPVRAGDVDGDGLQDLAFADPERDSGTVTIVFGKAELGDDDARPGSTLVRQYTAAAGATYLGSAVVAVGDNDGVVGDELWISAPAEGLSLDDSPCATMGQDNSLYLAYGGPPEVISASALQDGSAGIPLQGECGFGLAVSLDADLDGDGDDDLFITTAQGKAHWFSGGTSEVRQGEFPSAGSYRFVDGCESRDGESLRFASRTHRRNILPSADYTGDGVDDLVVHMLNLTKDDQRLVILTGDARWR
jgi:hypothetical protein